MANSRSDAWLDSYLANGPSGLDRGLFAGPVLAIFGLLAGQPALSGGAAAYWVFSYAYCAPWMAHQVRRRSPAQDHHLVAAVLAWASTPWALFILYGDRLTQPDTLRWAALAAMAPGAVAGISAKFAWKPRSSPWRSAVLLSGGLIYLGWIAAYVWLAALGLSSEGSRLAFGGSPAIFFVGMIALLPTPFMALWVGVRLLLGPLEPEVPTQTPATDAAGDRRD